VRLIATQLVLLSWKLAGRYNPGMDRSFKIVVCFERRDDGGLRAWSDDVPGLVLSHKDADGVLADVLVGIREILSDRLGATIEVRPLDNIREVLQQKGVIDPPVSIMQPIGAREYVATVH
jgi:hypothetical protein